MQGVQRYAGYAGCTYGEKSAEGAEYEEEVDGAGCTEDTDSAECAEGRVVQM